MSKLLFYGLAALAVTAPVAMMANAQNVCDNPANDYLTNGGPSFTWYRLRTREHTGSSVHPSLYYSGEMRSWRDEGVSKGHEKDLTFSILNQPARANVKYIAFFVAGQQGGDHLGNYGGWFEVATGSFQDWNSPSNFPTDQISVSRGLDSKSGAYRFYTESALGKIFPRSETLIIDVFDAAFYYLENGGEKDAILDGWISYLENKVIWSNIKGLFGQGFSRGGCFVARFYDRLMSKKTQLQTNAKLILETLDPVCKPSEWDNVKTDINMDNPVNSGNYYTFGSRLGNLFSGMPKDNIRWSSYVGGNAVAGIAHAYTHINAWHISSATVTSGSTTVTFGVNAYGFLNPAKDDILYTNTGARIGQVSSVSGNTVTLYTAPSFSYTGSFSINGQSSNGIDWYFKTPAGNTWYEQHWVDEDHCSIGEAQPNPTDFVRTQLDHAHAAGVEFGTQTYNLPPTYGAWSACTARANACGGVQYRLKSWTANGVPKAEQESMECFIASNPCVYSDWINDNQKCQKSHSDKKASITASTCGAWTKGTSFTNRFETNTGLASAATTGTIVTSSTSTTYTTKTGLIGSGFPVTGTGTSLNTQVVAGDYIGTANGVLGKVAFVESATKIYLQSAPLFAVTTATAFAVRKPCEANGHRKAFATSIPFCTWNPTPSGSNYVCNAVPATGSSTYLFDEDRNLHAGTLPAGANAWVDGAQPGSLSSVSSTPATTPAGTGYAVNGAGTVFQTFYPIGYQPGDSVYVNGNLLGKVLYVASDSLLYLKDPPAFTTVNNGVFFKQTASSAIPSSFVVADSEAELQYYSSGSTTISTPPPGPSGSGAVSYNPNCLDAQAQTSTGLLTKCYSNCVA